MVRVLRGQDETYAACEERLIGYARRDYAAGKITVEELEAKVERILTDHAHVESEREHWEWR